MIKRFNFIYFWFWLQLRTSKSNFFFFFFLSTNVCTSIFHMNKVWLQTDL
jgi:hypothetical protein